MAGPLMSRRRPSKPPRPSLAPDHRRDKPAASPTPATVTIYGFHAAAAALRAGRRTVRAVFASEAAAARLAPEIAAAGLVPRIVGPEELTRRLGPQAVHQGILLEADPIAPLDISEIEPHGGLVLVLDQITDPHNVGAILRTAAAFAVDALVTTTRHAPAFAGIVAKAASGGLDHVPLVEVVNLARALDTLGSMGFWRIGLDSDGADDLETAPLTGPVVLVLGAEDKGLRRLTRERCDVLARLDMPGAIKSLNVSNACAIALSVAHRRLGAQRGPQGGGAP